MRQRLAITGATLLTLLVVVPTVLILAQAH
jgi:hypothetical protein